MTRERGFALVEVVVTAFVITAGFLVLYTVFQLSIQHAAKTRHWAVAQIVADSLLEEMQAHPYGAAPPPSWERPTVVTAIIQGRVSRTEYRKTIRYQNGSAVGRAAGDSDLVTVTVTWDDPGADGKLATKSYAESTALARSP